MGDVQELRLVLTVSDFEAAVALYRDALGLAELAAWSDGDAKIVVLDGGRATLELINEEQAKAIDQVEVGSRVSGPVRIALRVRPGSVGLLEVQADQRMILPVTPTGDKPIDLELVPGVYTAKSPQMVVRWEPARTP